MKDRRDAWEALHSGFERGVAGGKRGRTLYDASQNMRAERAFMQVYWSGAAIFLLADLELQRESAGRVSLDSVLDKFRECCLPSDRRWNDREVIDKLDALGEARVLRRLYARYLHFDAFPDLNAAYRALGLVPTIDPTHGDPGH